MQLDKLKESGKNIGVITVCKGVQPKDGQIEHFVLLKEFGKKVGKVIDDNRIDFKEKDIFTPVVRGEVILEKKHNIPAIDGFDVTGNVLKGELLGEKYYLPGTNIEPTKENPNLYVSIISGVLSVSDRKVSVQNKVTINSDIDLQTGNIKAEGSVEIFGNVKSGFEVHVGGDIIVHGNVEDCPIVAGGNVTIDNGVLGKDKAYIEGNDISIRFAQNCKLKAHNNIKVTESLVQCYAFAKNTIVVLETVVGGEIVGKKGVSVKIAGSDKGVDTKLVAGVDPEVDELIKLKEEEKKVVESAYTGILEDMKMQFGNQFLIDLKGFLGILKGSRKVKFIEMLGTLSEETKKVNKMKEEIAEVRKLISFITLPSIVVHERVHADVTIQIRKAIIKIKRSKLGTTFKEDPQSGTIIE